MPLNSDIFANPDLPQTVYGRYFGLTSGFFKYAPATLFFFSPLAALPWEVARAIFFSAGIASLVFLFLYIPYCVQRVFVQTDLKKFQWMLLPFLIAFFAREIKLGNINLFLLCLLVSSIWAFYNDKNRRGGIFLALALLFKPHFGALILLLLFMGRLRAFFWTVVFGSVFLLIPFVVFGASRGTSFYIDWFDAVKGHNTADFAFQNHNYLPSMLYYWGKTLGFSAPVCSFVFAGAHIVIAIAILLILAWSRRRFRDISFVFFVLGLALVALVPSIVNTDTEHFLYAWPMLFALTVMLRKLGDKRKKLFFGVLLFLMGCGMRDLIGVQAFHFWTQAGILGLANLLLVALCLHSLDEFIQREKPLNSV